MGGTYILGIILCADPERGAYLAYTITNVFGGVAQSWVLANQPDGVANGSGNGPLPGDGLLVPGNIVKLRIIGIGHATNPTITFAIRRELSDTTLVYDYTGLTYFTGINLKDYYALWSLATDGCRAGMFADGGFGANASIPITKFSVTATKRTPAALPSTPIKYGVIGDSITTLLPATANTRQKLVVPAAMDLALVSLTNYNGHENLKGFGRSFATSATIINSATYVGVGSSALNIVIIMIGTNDADQVTPTTKAQYKTNVTALAAQINAACKILLVRPANINTANATVGNAALITYGAALDEITASLNATTPGRCYQVSLAALDHTVIADGIHWTKNTTLQPQGAAIIAGGIAYLLAGVNSVSINQGSAITVTGDATTTLTATLDPVDSPAPIAWSILSGTGTINPSSGLFQAPGAGVSAKVTVVRATAGGQTDDITITTPPAGSAGRPQLTGGFDVY